jgi:hypothetical protein
VIGTFWGTHGHLVGSWFMPPTSRIAPATRVARQSGWEGGDDQECILTVAADLMIVAARQQCKLYFVGT